MDFEFLLKIYLVSFGLVVLLAWWKNRSILELIMWSLLFSPILVSIWLLFAKSLESYSFVGEKNLSNESYLVYLTKQYHIEKIETINKFRCFGATFDSAEKALEYAYKVDNAIPLDISEYSANKPSSKDIISPKVDGVEENKNKSGLILFTVLIAVLLLLIFLITSNVMKVDFPVSSIFKLDSLSFSLEDAIADDTVKLEGELADAFNLNSRYTDVHRENLLKKIKNKIVIWEIEVYEVRKVLSNQYQISTIVGVSGLSKDAGLYVDLKTRNGEEVKFIESVKTGDKIKIKGRLTGDTFMRGIEVSPAILWYPNRAQEVATNKDEKLSNQIDGLRILNSELSENPNGGFIFSVSISNESTSSVESPNLKVTLVDDKDNIIDTLIFSPSFMRLPEYLNPNQSQLVKFSFRIPADKESLVVGYRASIEF